MPQSTLYIQVKPRSRSNRIMRTEAGVVVCVTAPPVEGAANTAVIRALADALSVPKSHLAITSGSTSRFKQVIVNGLSQQELDRRIDAIVAHSPD